MVQDDCWPYAGTCMLQPTGGERCGGGGVSKDILMAKLSHATPGYKTLPGLLSPQGFPCCFLNLWSHLGAHVSATPRSWTLSPLSVRIQLPG